MKQKLKCISEKVASDLIINIPQNLAMYRADGFKDFESVYGWSVELQIYVDLDPLFDLEPRAGHESEVKNALLVWRALNSLTPNLACENRIWTRLTHLEGFKYAKDRWLNMESDDAAIKSVRDHFFAETRTKWRDDNALSRLWWAAYIASLVHTIEQEEVLRVILNKADIRSNFIERSQISSRPKLASGIIRAIMSNKWISDKEINFRLFMKSVNKYGGGVLFEAWKDSDIDEFISQCVVITKSRMEPSTQHSC